MPATVSVVIPIRNGGEHVPALLERIDAMPHTDVEFIVVDDGSTDDTRPQLDKASASLPLTVLSGPGRGVAAARNLAVSEAQGTFVWFADCDDDWEPSVISELVAAATGGDADLVVCNATKVFVGEDRANALIEDAPRSETIDGERAFRRLLTGEIEGHLWNKLFSRALLGEDPFPPTRAHSDLGAALAVLPRALRVVLLPRALYRYHVHGNSILNSREYRWDDLPDCLDIAVKAGRHLGMSPVDPDLRSFSATHVALPMMGEVTRRADLLSPIELRTVRRRIRRLARATNALHLLRSGRAAPAVRILAFTASPGAYARVYGWVRRRRWSSVDAFNPQPVEPRP